MEYTGMTNQLQHSALINPSNGISKEHPTREKLVHNTDFRLQVRSINSNPNCSELRRMRKGLTAEGRESLYLILQSAKYATTRRGEVVNTTVSVFKVTNSRAGQETTVAVVIIHEFIHFLGMLH
jgi:hypothetical protein